MIYLYVGLNGAGKTLHLFDIQDTMLARGKKCVSNLKDVMYKGLDSHRVDIVTRHSSFVDIFDYREVSAAKDSIISLDDEYAFSQKHLELLTLLCRPGEILILDEPDFYLDAWEICTIRELLPLLSKTFEEVHLVTHCRWLFPVADEIKWVESEQVCTVSEEEMYARFDSV